MLILVVVILVLVREAAQPLGTVFFFFLLEDLDLDAGKGNLYVASLSTDNFSNSDALKDSSEQLNILIHVNVGSPAVCNAEKRLLKHDQVHCFLATGVVDPLLGNLAGHLLLSVQRQQHLVDALKQGRVLVFGDNVAGAVGAWLRVQQLPEAGAYTLKLSMHKQPSIVCLANDRVHKESFKKQVTVLERCCSDENRRACFRVLFIVTYDQ